MKVKNDPALLGLAAVVVICLTVALAMGKIGWLEFAAGLGLSQVPSLFGRKGGE